MALNSLNPLNPLDTERRPHLYGREAECETLAALVSEARYGRGTVLVVHGEPGTGKTALLDYATSLAGDVRVVRAAGAEPEAGLAYAGVHQLCGSMTSLASRLSAPQRAALEVAFGLREGRDGAEPDRMLVGLGVLSLLAAAAADGPLICVIDDAQWLDRASRQALAFAARRAGTLPVLVIFATREPAPDLSGLPEMAVGALRDTDARRLLASMVPGPLDEEVTEQVVAEARGIPRTLLELPGLPLAQLAGGFGPPDTPPSRVPGALAGELHGLPPQTRKLLLAAAADPTGNLALLWRAAGHLGITSEAALPAAEAGLATFAGRVLFRDRSVRLAAYQAGSRAERQAVHRALALATDPGADPDRRAWHRSQAGDEPDEDVAAELERTADRARGRGGFAAAAALLQRAVTLTPDAGRRAERALAAAGVALKAGDAGAVARLLSAAEPHLAGDDGQARVRWLHARLAVTQHRGGDVPRLLLDAARRLDPADTAQVRAAYLDAIGAATLAAGLAAAGGSVRDVARAAAKAPAADAPGPSDLLLDGLAACLSNEYAAGAPLLRQALDGFTQGSAAEELRWLPLAGAGALALWDDSAWETLSARFVRLARRTGALGDLPLALNRLACARVIGGDLAAAESLVREARRTAAAAGGGPCRHGAVSLAALSGRLGPALTLIDSACQDCVRRGDGLGAATAQWAAAVLYNGHGRYREALAAAEAASEYAGPSVLACWLAAELVEAAAREGRPDRAAPAMSRLAEVTSAAGSDWALGVQARSLALLSGAGPAEDQYRAATEHLGRSRDRVGLARAHLLYGEWLRRENRRVDAREQLHRAHRMFGEIGADGFAERARRELLATGETVRKRTVAADRSLTAQELQVAVRARDGRTNAEIGAELFLSHRTVEWHLRKVFAKLGITSRGQLQHVLPGAASPRSGLPPPGRRSPGAGRAAAGAGPGS